MKRLFILIQRAPEIKWEDPIIQAAIVIFFVENCAKRNVAKNFDIAKLPTSE